MIRAIGFDFDGTLIISEKEKAEIYYSLFDNKRGIKKLYSELVGKMNRLEKIAYIIRTFYHREPTKKEVKEISMKFSAEYLKKFNRCPLVSCSPFLIELRKQVKFMFLLSLEDKTDVKKLAKHCGIDKYFNEVLGGPKTKVKNFQHVLKVHKIKPSEALYIGDSREDIVSAKECGMHVIGVNKRTSIRKIMKMLGADYTFSDLCHLKSAKVLGNK